MPRPITLAACLAAAILTVPATALARPAARGHDAGLPASAASAHGRHVLLVSVDGLHASDLSKFVDEHPGSALANLGEQGTTYSSAQGSFPTDSFPGLLALVTGGTPRSTGVYYDDSYDRSLYAPAATARELPAPRSSTTSRSTATRTPSTGAAASIPPSSHGPRRPPVASRSTRTRSCA